MYNSCYCSKVHMMENETTQEVDEKRMLARLREGNIASFDDFVVCYSPKLLRIAYGLLGNMQDAEEVVQDSFVRAYRALPDFRGDSSLDTWLYRITVNLARNKFHWNQRRGGGSNISLSQPVNAKNEVTELDTDLPDSRLQPGQQLESDELNANITQGIRKLPGKLRETMMLRHINDYSYEQIASMLDCKIGTLKSRLARGREMLREYLRAIEEGRVPEAFQTHPDDEE